MGVLTAIRRNCGIELCHSRGEQDHFLHCVIKYEEICYNIYNVYAPNDSLEHLAFFEGISKQLVDNYVLLGGDFNSVIDENDCLSQKTDATLHALLELLTRHDLLEPDGHKQYTYQHPMIAKRKS